MEKEFKGTQGEWVLNEKYQTIEDSEGYGIAQQNGIKNSEKWLYDAQLISEAPNLLQALRDLVWLFEHHASDEELSESINLRSKKVLEKVLKQSCKAGVSGGFFFYLLYSAEKGRKTHIQHEDGSKPCKSAKVRLSDGSMDKIEYIDGVFKRWQYDRIGASYGKPYIVQTIPNPITCVKCQEWLSQNHH